MSLIPLLEEFIDDPAIAQRLWSAVQRPLVRGAKTEIDNVSRPAPIFVHRVAPDADDPRDVVLIQLFTVDGRREWVARIENAKIVLYGEKKPLAWDDYPTTAEFNESLARLAQRDNSKAQQQIRRWGIFMLWQSMLMRGGSHWLLWERPTPEQDGYVIELRSILSIAGATESVPFFIFFLYRTTAGGVHSETMPVDTTAQPELDAEVPLPRPLWHNRNDAGSGVMSLTDIVARQLAQRPTLIPRDLSLPEELRERVVRPVKLREPIQACASCGRRDASWTSSGAVRVCDQQCSDDHWERFHL